MGNDYALVVSSLVISYLKFEAALCCRLCQLTLLHSERPKLHRVLVILSAIRLIYAQRVCMVCLGCTPNLLFPKCFIFFFLGGGGA